jgi:putative phosphoribosyl transferase
MRNWRESRSSSVLLRESDGPVLARMRLMPDPGIRRLAAVTAPTLLIVGGLDSLVLDLNRDALAQLRCESKLAVVPGATHLFEEPGTVAMAAGLARDWFVSHLSALRVGS